MSMSMGDMKMEMPPMAEMPKMKKNSSSFASSSSSSSSGSNNGWSVCSQSNGNQHTIVVTCDDPKNVSLIVNGRPAKIKFKD